MMKFSAIYEGHKIDVIYESKLITSRFELHLDEDLKSSVNRKIIKNDELTLQTVYIENEKDSFKKALSSSLFSNSTLNSTPKAFDSFSIISREGDRFPNSICVI